MKSGVACHTADASSSTSSTGFSVLLTPSENGTLFYCFNVLGCGNSANQVLVPAVVSTVVIVVVAAGIIGIFYWKKKQLKSRQNSNLM